MDFRDRCMACGFELDVQKLLLVGLGGTFGFQCPEVSLRETLCDNFLCDNFLGGRMR